MSPTGKLELRLHVLKSLPEFFEPAIVGEKTFEIRRNDRDFRVGDLVLLYEWSDAGFTGRVSDVYSIEYVFPGGKFGLDSDYCVFSIRKRNV